jgi:hypothetical protein
MVERGLRFPDRQVSAKGTEKAQVEALTFISVVSLQQSRRTALFL